jgi:hypothetical protein
MICPFSPDLSIQHVERASTNGDVQDVVVEKANARGDVQDVVEKAGVNRYAHDVIEGDV